MFCNVKILLDLHANYFRPSFTLQRSGRNSLREVQVIFEYYKRFCVRYGRGGRYSGYIVTSRYYFKAITVSRKVLLSDIIVISILSRFTNKSLYVLNYTNLVRMEECSVESIVV